MKLLIKSFLILLLTGQAYASLAQNCKVPRSRVKSNETETLGESVSSKDFYTLLIEKTFYKIDKTKTPEYAITLVAASRVAFSDSMLTTKGTFEFTLADNSVIVATNVRLENFTALSSLAFSATIDEDKFKAITKSPIVTVKVKEINLVTAFADKKQKQMQAICACLLTK